jgi:hypothetical protein
MNLVSVCVPPPIVLRQSVDTFPRQRIRNRIVGLVALSALRIM